MIKNITVEEIERQYFKYHLSQAGLDEIEILKLSFYLEQAGNWQERPTQSNCDLFSFNSEDEGHEDMPFGVKSVIQELEEKGMIETKPALNSLNVNISPYLFKIYEIATQLQEDWRTFFQNHDNGSINQIGEDAIQRSALRFLQDHRDHLLKMRKLLKDPKSQTLDPIDFSWSIQS